MQRMTHEGALSGAAFRRRLAILLILALAARVALLIFVTRNPTPFDFPDSHRYVQVARNIAAGLGPIDSSDVRSGTDPVYPAILSIGIQLGIESTDAILMFGRAVNCLCGMALVAVVAFLGRRIFSARVGLFAAAWIAIDPVVLFFNGLALTELPYMLLLTGAIHLVLIFQDTHRLRHALAAGALFGLSALTRSSGLFLPAFVAIWMVVDRSRSNRDVRAARPATHAIRQRGLGAALMLAMMLLVLTPTILRNYGLFGSFVPVRTGSGASLLEALGPHADGGPGMQRITYPPVPEGSNEFERDRLYRDAALDWAATHPVETLRLAMRKLARTWSITMNADAYQSGFYAAVCWLTVAPVFVLAVAGAWRLRRQGMLLAVLLFPGAYFTLVHVVFVGSIRYRLPALPFIFLLAAFGFDALIDRFNRRTASAQA